MMTILICNRFADLLEDTFTIAFAIQLAMSTAWISITLLQVFIHHISIVFLVFTKRHSTCDACAFWELNTVCFTINETVEKIRVTYLFIAFEIALQSGDFIETGRYVAFIIGQLIHLFFFSIQGQKMIDHSVEVRDNV